MYIPSKAYFTNGNPDGESDLHKNENKYYLAQFKKSPPNSTLELEEGLLFEDDENEDDAEAEAKQNMIHLLKLGYSIFFQIMSLLDADLKKAIDNATHANATHANATHANMTVSDGNKLLANLIKIIDEHLSTLSTAINNSPLMSELSIKYATEIEAEVDKIEIVKNSNTPSIMEHIKKRWHDFIQTIKDKWSPPSTGGQSRKPKKHRRTIKLKHKRQSSTQLRSSSKSRTKKRRI